MYIEKDSKGRPELQGGAVFSPVFKISSRNTAAADERPPSPPSPSPQRRMTLINDGSNSAATTPSKTLLSSASKPPPHSASLKLNTSHNASLAGLSERSFNSSSSTSVKKVQASHKSPSKGLATQRIPSSATPSPLATRLIGSSGKTNQSAEPSTAVFALQPDSAKALSRNLGAILGSKRAAEDDLEGGTSSATSGAEGSRKRPRRPQANRPKQSDALTPRKLGTVPPLNLHEDTEESQYAMSMGTSMESLGGIAVNYSDPAEVEERRRLLMLINKSEGATDEPEVYGKRKVGPRKSARQRGLPV